MLMNGIFLALATLPLALQYAAPAIVTLQQVSETAPATGRAADPPAGPDATAPGITRPPAVTALPEAEAEPEPAPTSPPASARASVPPAGTATDLIVIDPADWPPYLERARSALAGVVTAQGRFAQINHDGSVLEGDFALRRPGRMRFDYDAPSGILIVADGATVAIRDTDLETVDRVPLSSTPLGVLLDDDIDFGAEVETLRVLQWSDQLAITVQDLSGDVEGMLTLLFDPRTDSLTGWQAVDTEGLTTRIALDNVRTGLRISPALFRLDEPEDEEDER